MSAAAATTSSQDKAAESVYNYLQLPDVGWWGGGGAGAGWVSQLIVFQVVYNCGLGWAGLGWVLLGPIFL